MIEFNINIFFWTAVGATLGILFTHLWTKFRERNKIFANIYCQRESDLCFYLFIVLTNEGNSVLPKLSIKLKNSAIGSDFYFEQIDSLNELKPFQHSTYRVKLTDQNLVLDKYWLLFLEFDYYDSYIKISRQNSSTPIFYRHDFALRVIAQLLYYKENNFSECQAWKWIPKSEKMIYLDKVKKKIPLSTRAVWNRFPSHYRLNHYHNDDI